MKKVLCVVVICLIAVMLFTFVGCDFIQRNKGKVVSDADALKGLFVKYAENGGKLSYDEWLDTIMSGSNAGIASIEKTSSEGLVDTYTITLTNGQTSTFTVTNGKDSGGKEALPEDPNAPTPDSYFLFTLLEDDTYAIEAKYHDMPARVVIPSSYNGKKVTVIGVTAFLEIRTIEEVVIPSTVTDINSSAFLRCKGLKTITIPSSVTYIDRSLTECPALTSIIFGGTKEEWSAIDRSSDWDYRTNNYTVHCSDGDIAKAK